MSRNVNCAIRRHLDMAGDATEGAYRGIVNRNARAKSLSSVIAARALRFGGDVLGTVVNRVRRSVRSDLRWRCRIRVRIIGSAAKGFVVGACSGAPSSTWKIRSSVII